MKSEYLEVRLSAAEKQAFRESAEIAGIPLSSWVRERLCHAAIRELENASRDIPFLRKAAQS